MTKTITASLVFYTQGKHGPIQHSGGCCFYNVNSIASDVKNVSSIFSRPGANHIVLDIDRHVAVQVSGYNDNRGMFCDVVPLEELRPFLD